MSDENGGRNLTRITVFEKLGQDERTKDKSMAQKRVSTSELKTRCAQVIDRVVKGREALVIVRRGRPVAKLVPIEKQGTSLFGALRGCLTVHGDIISPTDEPWDALQ